MSPREQLNHIEVTIATLVWQGRTNPEIGALMGTSEQVVKTICGRSSTNSGSGAAWSWRCMLRRMADTGGLRLYRWSWAKRARRPRRQAKLRSRPRGAELLNEGIE